MTFTYEDFVDRVNSYMTLHEEITETQKMLNTLKQKKKQMQQEAIQFMEQHKIDECELDDCFLTKYESNRKAPVNKTVMLGRLAEKIGPDTIQEVMQDLDKDRTVSVSVSLRKRAKKEKKDKDKPNKETIKL